MKTIGVDLHKHNLNALVLDDAGAVVERREFSTKCRNQIAQYFESQGPLCRVAVESVGFYQWFWELVRPRVSQLCLADPAGVRAFAGRKKAKTDRNDALLLAQLLRDNRLPMAFVPSEPVRLLRELVRHRHSIAQSLASERRQLRWICLKYNLPGPRVLTSDLAQKWLLTHEEKLSSPSRLSARQRLNHLITLEQDEADVAREISRAVDADESIRQQVELIRSVPGIGFLTAVTIVAETGDIRRFNRTDELSSYAGLAPRVSQSGQTLHHGHISKAGPPSLRWMLQQAAWVAIRTDAEVKKIFLRLSKRTGAKKACTAVARKLLTYAWSVCKRGVPFHWPGQEVPEAGGNWSYNI